jgi:hypothetical protein
MVAAYLFRSAKTGANASREFSSCEGLRVLGVHVHDEVSVCRKECHLTFRIATIGTMGGTMEGENSNDLIGDPGFLSSVVEIEMECWQNDILGTKEVLMKLGCSSAKAEKAIGSYLGRRFSRREIPQQT